MPLLLTVGEPAGIGPDILLRTFVESPELFDDIVVVAPPLWLVQRANEIGVLVVVSERTLPFEKLNKSGSELRCFNPCPFPTPAAICGRTSRATASAVITCIEAAARLCLSGQASGMVTGPIEKAVLRDSGFLFPGHTEFLAGLAGGTPVVMMLAADQLKVALLTTHLPLAAVSAALNVADTLTAIRIVHRAFCEQFGLPDPKLALCALNPHGGEAGHFGREELTILQPAVDLARAEGINITNPLPSDTLFSPLLRHNFDAFICCYHDQGLIPLKALAFGEAVNVTLGLPFVRTSVDHGTALDKAGTAAVSCRSLRAAIQLARVMAGNGSSHQPLEVCHEIR